MVEKYYEILGLDVGASGNSPAEFFASDIDGSWYYAASQMTMLFKAFSKKEIETNDGVINKKLIFQ
jgi:hypothetical protein